MISAANQKNEGLHFRLLIELEGYEKEAKLRGRFAGIVLKAYREQKNNTFIISDGTATAQVNLIYRKIPLEFELPTKGDSVQIVGFGYKKVIGGGSIRKNAYSFYKIHASGIKKITPEEQLQMNIQAAQQYRKKAKFSTKIQVYEKLQPQIKVKTFQSIKQQIELRTLVLVYCYYVFEHNPDIQSYIFNAQMIRSSKDGNQFLNDARVTKSCLQAAITKTLQEMVQFGFLTQKTMVEQNTKSPFFVVKKELFRGMQKAFEQKIIMETKESKGTYIQQLTAHVNKHLAQHYKINFLLFDWKLSNKILFKLQNQNRIYKTADKLIYANVRI